MDTRDVILGPIYFIIIILFARLTRNDKLVGSREGRYFMYALIAKLIGAVVLGLIYKFYYDGGDTYSFFFGGVSFSKLILKDPINAIEFFWQENNPFVIQRLKELNPAPRTNYILRGSSELLTVKITGILATLGLQCYTATALLFAAISFSGLWKLYQTLLHYFPSLKKELAIATFFLPSVVFWGSGILKDTIIIASIGWVIYAVFQLFIKGRIRIKYILISLVGLTLIGLIKGYVLIAFFPAILFWIAMNLNQKLPSGLIKLITLPFLAMLLGIITLITLSRFSEFFGRYELERLQQTAEATQWWHTVANEEGSVYSLGEINYTPVGLLRKFPAAVNVTLFRPYIWEANGFVALISSIESLLIFLITIRLLIKAKLRGIKKGLQHPLVAFCLIFAIIMAFAVGFTSYNFGALVRYKIPLMPFYVGALFMMGYLAKEHDNEVIRK